MGMFEAKGIDFGAIAGAGKLSGSSADGRGFAVSGGVASAVVNCIHEMDPEREVKVASAEGLRECREMMNQAKKGLYNGYLLEGMACPGGCVGGAGVLQSPTKSKGQVKLNMKKAKNQGAYESDYKEYLESLEERTK